MTKGSDFKQSARALADELGIPYAEARSRLLRTATATPGNSPGGYFDERVQTLAESQGISEAAARTQLAAALDVDLADLSARGMLTQSAARFLSAAMQARMNIMVGGNTGAGKTTLARALAHEIGPDARFITIERAPELCLSYDDARHPDCVEWKELPASPPGPGMSMGQLISSSIRFGYDRLVVDELQGAEVINLLNLCMGDTGAVSTIRASSAGGVIDSLTANGMRTDNPVPAEAIRQMAGNGLDLIVFLATDPGTGRRRVGSVHEVNGYDHASATVRLDSIFALDATGQAAYTGARLSRANQLQAAGWVREKG